MATPEIRVLPDPQAVAREAADRIVLLSAQGMERRGTFSLILAGGTTPIALYELLATPQYLSRIEWARAEVYFGDERNVPPDHLDSNYRMARQALLDKAGIPPSRVHRIRGEIDPSEAAIEYGRLLRDRFGDGGPDLVLLGMGDDGHTASLFPHTSALSETHHRCVANFVEKLNRTRITLTPPFLNRAGCVIVLVYGAAKAGRVADVLEGERDPLRLPIQLIDPVPPGRLIWLLDAAAAGMDEE
jgi:6-phosphogluconolactonase